MEYEDVDCGATPVSQPPISVSQPLPIQQPCNPIPPATPTRIPQSVRQGVRFAPLVDDDEEEGTHHIDPEDSIPFMDPDLVLPNSRPVRDRKPNSRLNGFARVVKRIRYPEAKQDSL